jgi:hypothetical protein
MAIPRTHGGVSDTVVAAVAAIFIIDAMLAGGQQHPTCIQQGVCAASSAGSVACVVACCGSKLFEQFMSIALAESHSGCKILLWLICATHVVRTP